MMQNESTTTIHALPMPTGNWSNDNSIGRRHAQDLIRRMQDNNDPVALSYVMREFASVGRFGGVEAGFVQEIAERLISS